MDIFYFIFYLLEKRQMIKNSVAKMKNLVVNYESQPVKSNRGSYLLYQLFDSNGPKRFFQIVSNDLGTELRSKQSHNFLITFSVFRKKRTEKKCLF